MTIVITVIPMAIALDSVGSFRRNGFTVSDESLVNVVYLLSCQRVKIPGNLYVTRVVDQAVV